MSTAIGGAMLPHAPQFTQNHAHQATHPAAE